MLPKLRTQCALLIARAIRHARTFGRDTSGGIAVVFAVLSPVAIASMGLGAEAGYWYLEDRKVQGAADVAAHGVGRRRAAGDEQAALQTLAEYIVGRSDIDLAAADVQINMPPTQGAFTGNPNAIEVIVERTVPRMFSKMYSSDDITITGRAVVAVVADGIACILGLHPSDYKTVEVTGSADIDLQGCEIAVNSNHDEKAFVIQGNGSSLSAECIRVVGEADQHYAPSLVCGSTQTGQPAVADPFADLPEPQAIGACNDKKQENKTLTPNVAHPSGMMSMRFCDGLDLKGNVTLNPGLYIIEKGDLKINSNANIQGNGVVFFVGRHSGSVQEDGKVSFNGNATINLTAPSSGVYEGMLIFGSRGNDKTFKINGNAGTSLNGAIYNPGDDIEISGSSTTDPNSCTQYIASTIKMTGNAQIVMHCNNPFRTSATIGGDYALVE